MPFAGNVRMPMAAGLSAAVMGFVFSIIGMFLLAVIVNLWAPFFNGKRQLSQALKVAAYTAVPGWVGSFFGLLPVLGVLIGLVAAIYCIYVLYLGLPIVMRAPRERATGYTVAVILTGMVAGIVLGGVMMATGGMSRFGMPGRSADAQAEESAAITGNIIGNMLGTDDKGKAALGQAINNMARAGQQMQDANPPATNAPAPTPAEAAARAQRDAVQAGNVIGNMLGTDPQGRSALGQALGNMARAGQDLQQGTAAPNGISPSTGAAPVDPNAGANAGAAVGGLLTALGGALGGSHRVTPVDFRTLQTLLPATVNGLPRGATEGENRQAMGVKASSASAGYGAAGNLIHIKISDVSGVSGLIDIAGNLAQTTDSESATGFERDTTIGGRSVHEKFTNAGKQGELQVIVAKRFEVDVDGSGVDIGTPRAGRSARSTWRGSSRCATSARRTEPGSRSSSRRGRPRKDCRTEPPRHRRFQHPIGRDTDDDAGRQRDADRQCGGHVRPARAHRPLDDAGDDRDREDVRQVQRVRGVAQRRQGRDPSLPCMAEGCPDHHRSADLARPGAD